MITAVILAALQCPPSAWVTPELERYSVYSFDCNSRSYNVIDNVIYAAEEYYWAAIELDGGNTTRLCKDPESSPTCTRAPCGGDANCAQPYLADYAYCWVEETDCWTTDPDNTDNPDPIVLRTYLLECTGQYNCQWGAERMPADTCCELLEVRENEVLETETKNSC